MSRKPKSTVEANVIRRSFAVSQLWAVSSHLSAWSPATR